MSYLFIDCMIQYFNLDTASIDIGSDCEGGLKRILLNTDQRPLYYVNDSHLDMINAINRICRTSILKTRGRHIPSHQAETCMYENFDWWGHRNDDMDWLAKSLMFEKRQLRKKKSMLSVSDGKAFAIIINKVKVSGNCINTIHDMIHGQAIFEYWIKQGRFPSNQYNNIDWDIIKHAREKLLFDRKIWMTKQVSGFCGTGVKMIL